MKTRFQKISAENTRVIFQVPGRPGQTEQVSATADKPSDVIPDAINTLAALETQKEQLKADLEALSEKIPAADLLVEIQLTAEQLSLAAEAPVTVVDVALAIGVPIGPLRQAARQKKPFVYTDLAAATAPYKDDPLFKAHAAQIKEVIALGGATSMYGFLEGINDYPDVLENNYDQIKEVIALGGATNMNHFLGGIKRYPDVLGKNYDQIKKIIEVGGATNMDLFLWGIKMYPDVLGKNYDQIKKIIEVGGATDMGRFLGGIKIYPGVLGNNYAQIKDIIEVGGATNMYRFLGGIKDFPDEWENNYDQIKKIIEVGGATDMDDFLLGIKIFPDEWENNYDQIKKIIEVGGATDMHNFLWGIKDYPDVWAHQDAEWRGYFVQNYSFYDANYDYLAARGITGESEFGVVADFVDTGTPLERACARDVLEESAERIIEGVNHLEGDGRSPAVRFEKLKEYSGKRLYQLISSSRGEQTSTFNMIVLGTGLPRKLAKQSIVGQIEASKQSGWEFLTTVDPELNHLAPFITKLAKFGQLESFMATIPSAKERTELIQSFIKQSFAAGNSDLVGSVAALSDFMGDLSQEIPERSDDLSVIKVYGRMSGITRLFRQKKLKKIQKILAEDGVLTEKQLRKFGDEIREIRAEIRKETLRIAETQIYDSFQELRVSEQQNSPIGKLLRVVAAMHAKPRSEIVHTNVSEYQQALLSQAKNLQLTRSAIDRGRQQQFEDVLKKVGEYKKNKNGSAGSVQDMAVEIFTALEEDPEIGDTLTALKLSQVDKVLLVLDQNPETVRGMSLPELEVFVTNVTKSKTDAGIAAALQPLIEEKSAEKEARKWFVLQAQEVPVVDLEEMPAAKTFHFNEKYGGKENVQIVYGEKNVKKTGVLNRYKGWKGQKHSFVSEEGDERKTCKYWRLERAQVFPSGEKKRMVAYVIDDPDSHEAVTKLAENEHSVIDRVGYIGHIYEVQRNLDHTPKSASFLNMRGCGGNGDVGKMMERNPGAYVLSTKQTGVARVNNFLLEQMNQYLWEHGEAGINWREFKQHCDGLANKKLSKRNYKAYQGYVFPHENKTAIIASTLRNMDE